MRGRTWIAAATAAGVVASLGLVVAAGGTAGASGAVTAGPVVDNGYLVVANTGTLKKPAANTVASWYKSGSTGLTVTDGTTGQGGPSTIVKVTDPTQAVATTQVLGGPATGSKCVMTSNSVTGTTTTKNAYPYLTFNNPGPSTQVAGTTAFVGYKPGYIGVDSIAGGLLSNDNSGTACQQVGDQNGAETISIQANNTTTSGLGQANGTNYFQAAGLDLNVSGDVVIVAHFYKGNVEIGRIEYQTGKSVGTGAIYTGDDVVPFCNAGVANSGPQNTYGSECFWTISPLGYAGAPSGSSWAGIGLLANPVPTGATAPAAGYNLFDRIDLESAGPKGGDFSLSGGNSFNDPSYPQFYSLGGATYFQLATQFPYGAGCGDYGTVSVPVGGTGGFATVSYKRLDDYQTSSDVTFCTVKYFSVSLTNQQLSFITNQNDPYAAWQFTYERDYPVGTLTGPPSMLSIDFTNTGSDFRSLGYCPSSAFSYPDGSAGAPTWSTYSSTTNAWSYGTSPAQPTFLSLSALQGLDWYKATDTHPIPGVQYACTYAQSQENVTVGGVSYQRFLDWTLLYGDLLTRGG